MAQNLYLMHCVFAVQESVSDLRSQEVDLDNIQVLGEQILTCCHPDSIITLKSWISVTKTRYEEVSPRYPGQEGNSPSIDPPCPSVNPDVNQAIPPWCA